MSCVLGRQLNPPPSTPLPNTRSHRRGDRDRPGGLVHGPGDRQACMGRCLHSRNVRVVVILPSAIPLKERRVGRREVRDPPRPLANGVPDPHPPPLRFPIQARGRGTASSSSCVESPTVSSPSPSATPATVSLPVPSAPPLRHTWKRPFFSQLRHTRMLIVLCKERRGKGGGWFLCRDAVRGSIF